jgi:hypothetical protein
MRGYFWLAGWWLLAALLTGCSTSTLVRPVTEKPGPGPSGTEVSPRSVVPELPSATLPEVTKRVQKPIKPAPPPAPKSATRTPAAGGDVFLQHLPGGIADRAGWARDYRTAFKALGIKPGAENVCAALAVTEQESSFNADPPVAGLPGIVRGELRQRAERYHVPAWMLDASLALTSPDGRTYGQRIDALKTENDLNRLYADLISQVPLGKTLLADYNPVRTGGPMQVSLKFAERQVREKPYPYRYTGSLRDELFSRRGGLYFGVAYLLDYPASYDRMLYRFADFNAGRYASRNAAFQKAVSLLGGQPLDGDGDLLRYAGGDVADEPSQTLLASRQLASRLQLTEAEIEADLRQEKSASFERTQLFTRVFALVKDQTGKVLPPNVLPEIQLKSPKIHNGLTTARFAQRVNQRYQKCLGRGVAG